MNNMTLFFGKDFKLKVAFFRKCDTFFSLPKECVENYPEKEIWKLRSALQFQKGENSKYKA